MNLNTSGKWASAEENTEEQIQALKTLDQYLDFTNSYTYTEQDIQNTNANTAQVIGFWTEESPKNRFDQIFVVYMRLTDDETVELKFPLEKPNSGGFIDRNRILEEFLKMFGVNSNNIGDIIGRKVIYEDLRDENTDSLDFGLSFYNSRRTRLSLMSQKLSMYIMLVGTLGIIPSALVDENLVLLSILTTVVGLLIASFDVVRRRFDHHSTVSIKNYLIE